MNTQKAGSGVQEAGGIHIALQSESSPIVQAKSTLFGMTLHSASDLTQVFVSRITRLPVRSSSCLQGSGPLL